MVEVKEYIDVKNIERLRKNVLNKSLDDNDNFSYHLGVFENGIIQGVARLYLKDGNAVIDCIAMTDENNFFVKDMITRTLILKAVSLTKEIISIYDNENNIYEKFGFNKKDEYYIANKNNIEFTHECKNCGKCKK